SNAKLRLKLYTDGTAEGYVGGYQPWRDYWFMAAFNEGDSGLDISTLYHNLSEFAEAKPDPVTGKNTAISATYRIEAVPAHLVDAPDPIPLRRIRARLRD